MVCVPIPADAGLNTPVEDTPGPDQVPPISAAMSCVDPEETQNGPTGVIAGFGGPVCAPGGGPSCMVKLLEDPLQFSTTIMISWPAVTFGAGTEELHGNAVPNWLQPLEALA